MSFILTNPNPDGLNVGDCSVTAKDGESKRMIEEWMREIEN